MLFNEDDAKPKSLAVTSGFNPSPDPARAPEPSGLTEVRFNQSWMRSKSRAKAWMCLAISWPNKIGWACCIWVNPGAGASAYSPAFAASAFCSSSTI